MGDHLMTISGLAMYLGVGLRTLCRYLRVHPLAQKDAQLPAIRIDGCWRFRKEDVDRWLRRHPVLDTFPRRQSHILVVDDDENFRSILLDLFEASGYGVQGVEDGEAALALLGEVSFDLLMVDLQMPGPEILHGAGPETLRGACPEILHGVHPERDVRSFAFAQDDTARRVQNDIRRAQSDSRRIQDDKSR